MPDFTIRMYRIACLLPGYFGAGRNPGLFPLPSPLAEILGPAFLTPAFLGITKDKAKLVVRTNAADEANDRSTVKI